MAPIPGSVESSATTSLTVRPIIPPSALISSTASCAQFTVERPRIPAGPDSDVSRPSGTSHNSVP